MRPERLFPHADQAEQRGLQEVLAAVHDVSALQSDYVVIVRFAPFGFEYTSQASLRCANQHVAHYIYWQNHPNTLHNQR